MLKFFLAAIQDNVENPEEQTVFVMHADNMDAALRMKEMIEESVPFAGVETGRRPGNRLPYRPRRAGRLLHGQSYKLGLTAARLLPP